MSSCPFPLPVSATHTHMQLPFPNSHLHSPSFSCVTSALCPEPKNYRLTQLKMPPETLPPSLQIQYFTLLAGILVHLVKLREEDMWQPITLWLCRVQLWVIGQLQHDCVYKRNYMRGGFRSWHIELGSQSDPIKNNMSIWPPYNVPVLGGNKWRIKQGSVAAVNVATRKKKKTIIKIHFGEPEGFRCSHWGDLTEVFLGSMTPWQADEYHNPCLIKSNGGIKLQYGFKKHTHTHTNKPNKRRQRSTLCDPWVEE